MQLLQKIDFTSFFFERKEKKEKKWKFEKLARDGRQRRVIISYHSKLDKIKKCGTKRIFKNVMLADKKYWTDKKT